MFEDKTVFVVGAGASAEFGLPVGWELLKKIQENSHFEFDRGLTPSKGPRRVFEAISEKYASDRDKTVEAFTSLADIRSGVATAGSIDEFINRYSDDSMIAELGKLQIAHTILEAEAKSHFRQKAGSVADGVNWNAVEDTWITRFVRTLFDGVKATEIDQIGNNISIICFNYDRCIEYYLEHAIRIAFRGVDANHARKIVDSIEILHPYGSLGKLQLVPFGSPVHSSELYRVSENLVTWSESFKEDDVLPRVKSAIKQARNIVFLGFGFANQNMKLLDAQMVDNKPYFTSVYATGHGLTDDVQVKLTRKIVSIYAPISTAAYAQHVKIKYGMTCKEFMEKQVLNFSA